MTGRGVTTSVMARSSWRWIDTWTRVWRLLAERSAAGPSCSGSPITSRLRGELTACPLISRLSPRLWTGVLLMIRWPLSAIASAPALRRLLSASCSSKSMIVPWIRICKPGPWTGTAPLPSRKVVSFFWIACAAAPPAVSASRSCASCCESAAPCWISWLLARFRSLIRSATLVSSGAARVRATAAWERSCTTRRKPSAMAIRLTTTSRWARAVPSAERLSILHQESGIEGRQTEVGRAKPAEAQPVDAAATLELRELVEIAQAPGQARGIPQRGHGIRAAQPAGIVDQDVDAGVVERRGRHDPLAIDGDRLRSARPQDVHDVLQILVVNGPAQRTVGEVVRVGAVVQQDREAGAVQRGQPGEHLLIVELGLHLLEGARTIGALVLAGLDLDLELLDACLERPILVLQLVDALAQGLVPGQAVGGRQWLASELGGREAGNEESRKRNACQDSHPRRHGAV